MWRRALGVRCSVLVIFNDSDECECVHSWCRALDVRCLVLVVYIDSNAWLLLVVLGTGCEVHSYDFFITAQILT